MSPSKSWIILLLAILLSALWAPSGCTQQSPRSSNALEFRIVLNEGRCSVDCEIVEIESLELGRIEAPVHRRADLVLEPREVVSVVPTKLSGIDPDRPDMIVWTGALKLTQAAAEQLRGLGERLRPEQQILISRDGEPLDVTYARLVGQMMAVGTFSSYGELTGALGDIGSFEEVREDVVEVFSPEELEARRKNRELLEDSEAMLRETQRIRGEAAAGRISEEEMVRRLKQLRQ